MGLVDKANQDQTSLVVVVACARGRRHAKKSSQLRVGMAQVGCDPQVTLMT